MILGALLPCLLPLINGFTNDFAKIEYVLLLKRGASFFISLRLLFD